jgi:hypothetical protein
MDNPFKQIIDNKEVPEALKEKVINNVNLIKLSLELSELYLVNMPEALCNLVSEIKEENEIKENVADVQSSDTK